MPHDVFSDPWARACAVVLNGNGAYRSAAATWEGALLLLMVLDDPGGERRVYLDLWHGECREARAASAADDAAARYILAGSALSWQQVLTGTVPPLMAIMIGKLKLTKGSLAELLPYVEASKQLVASAASVEAAFPGSP